MATKVIDDLADARATVEREEERAPKADEEVANLAAGVTRPRLGPRKGRAKEVAALDREIREAEEAITSEVIAFRERLASLVRGQAARVGRANALDGGMTLRGSYWASVAQAPGGEFHLASGHPAVHRAIQVAGVQASGPKA